jgi:hypothetical protein
VIYAAERRAPTDVCAGAGFKPLPSICSTCSSTPDAFTEFTRSWSSNLMTEWHAATSALGVMIYWHVESKNACIYSQLKTRSACEVAAMLDGLLRHDTSADIDRNDTDTHASSIVGFAFCHLLGFRLLARLNPSTPRGCTGPACRPTPIGPRPAR